MDQPQDAVDRSGKLTRPRCHGDFFLADLLGFALKADATSMEVPIFSLSTRPDLAIEQWTSQDGKRRITVTPSVLGRATQHDKDVLIYATSQLTAAADLQLPDAKYRTVRFAAYDFFKTTGRGASGADYRALKLSLRRLQGTTVTTNISTGGIQIDEGFGLIDGWRTVASEKRPAMVTAVEITLSIWLFNAIQSFEVFTLHKDYFRLRRPLERRLYELARKHCGRQPAALIGLELLRQKTGSKATLNEFRRMVREVMIADSLPEYRLLLAQNDTVTMYTKDHRKMTRAVTKLSELQTSWFRPPSRGESS
ncbi:replication initiator protein A [Paraburkholderia sp. WSM4175]|uniref:replication initiator protein A n=1 Tax=Paraburkholderia sp. WSM4175 TaxID=2991072 RepID=UPI003D1B2D15